MSTTHNFLITSMCIYKKIWFCKYRKRSSSGSSAGYIFTSIFFWKLFYIVLQSIWKKICQIDCTHTKMNNFLLKTWYTAASWWISYLWCRLLDAHRNLSSNCYVSYKTVINSNQQAFKLQLKYADAVILMAQTNFILSCIQAQYKRSSLASCSFK